MVAIDMSIAGLGSRFAALLVDYLIWAAAAIAIIFLIFLIDPGLEKVSILGSKWATAIEVLIPFLCYWGYFTLFEAFWDGRTPGKRVARIRVIQRSGRGIGLFESMTRNLLRIVDQFPFIYVVGAISVFVTRDHQRLGDLAAGTLVVHDRGQSNESASSSGRTFTEGIFESQPVPLQYKVSVEIHAAKLHGLGTADLEVLEGFLARRLDFSIQTREHLAMRIADGIRSKSGLEIPPGTSTETFLEEVARQLRDQTRMG